MKIISTDLGLTGFIAFCDSSKDGFIVNKTLKIKTESKNKGLFINKETTSIVKNQASFKLNYDSIIEEIDEDNHIGLYEQITTRPFNSTVSSMSLSDTSAVFRSIFESLDIDYMIIPPGTWKKHLNVTSDKKTSQNLFAQLVQKGRIKINFKKNIKNHNEIESILIAYFYHSTMLQ